MAATLSPLGSLADITDPDVFDAPTRVMFRPERALGAMRSGHEDIVVEVELEETKSAVMRVPAPPAPAPRSRRAVVTLGILLAFTAGVAGTLAFELYGRDLLDEPVAVAAPAPPPVATEIAPRVAAPGIAVRPETKRREAADLAAWEAEEPGAPARAPRHTPVTVENLLEDGLGM